MLDQNAQIIRKFIVDAQRGSIPFCTFFLSVEQIDLMEYSGLHTSVYLLSLFTKSKSQSQSDTSIPISTYQALMKKLKQVEMQVQNKQPLQ